MQPQSHTRSCHHLTDPVQVSPRPGPDRGSSGGGSRLSTCAPESDVTSADLESDRCDSPGDLLLGRDPEVWFLTSSTC
ncbi:hypothetical protein INR49_002293, partial [Caranx melampygus]